MRANSKTARADETRISGVNDENFRAVTRRTNKPARTIAARGFAFKANNNGCTTVGSERVGK